MAAVVFGTLVGLLAAEAGLRVHRAFFSARAPAALYRGEFELPTFGGACGGQTEQATLGEILRPSRLSDLIFELRPEIDTCFEGSRLRTNREGLRALRGYSNPKPEGVHRILLLGDSQTFGWGVSFEETFAVRLQRMLARDAVEVGVDVEVVNAAVPAYNAYQEAAFLSARGMAYEPDCIVVLFVGNDLALPHFLLNPDAEPGPSYLVTAVKRVLSSKRWYRWTEESLIGFVRPSDLSRVPPKYRHMVGDRGYREALRRIAEAAGEAGVPVINAADYSPLRHEVNTADLIRYQETLGIRHSELRWPSRRRYLLSDRDPHLNPRGHRRIARRLFHLLREGGFCMPQPNS